MLNKWAESSGFLNTFLKLYTFFYPKNKTQKTERRDPQSQLCHDPIQAGFRV